MIPLKILQEFSEHKDSILLYNDLTNQKTAINFWGNGRHLHLPLVICALSDRRLSISQESKIEIKSWYKNQPADFPSGVHFDRNSGVLFASTAGE